MRILLVIDGMHPRDGGPPAVVAGSAHALRRRGLDVTVLTTVKVGEEQVVTATWQSMIDSGVKLVFCRPMGMMGLLCTAYVDPTVSEAIADTDVLHLHGIWNPVLVIAARIANTARKPYLISTHGVLDERAMRRKWFKFAKKHVAVMVLRLRQMVASAHGVIFGSEAEANHSWKIHPAMKLVFVPNGVNADHADDPVSDSQREQLTQLVPQFAQWDRTLLYFARIHPEKGADMLVRAFNRVAPEYPNAGLLVAGLRQDERYQEVVERLVDQAPDPSRIAFTTKLTGPKCQFLYSLCDCFVLPSHAEGFSVALTEALARGKPSLITRYCHLPEVEAAGAGFIVEPNTDAIAEGLRKILAVSTEELAVMGQRARDLYQGNFTWERIAEKLEVVYCSAVEGERATVR